MKEIPFPHQIEAAITGNPFLSLLGGAERKECIQQSSLFTIPKGDTLYRAGDPADCVWAVVNGQAKIVKQSHSGRCLLIEIIMPGEICGGICYSENTHFVFSAFAMEETKALRFPLEVLQKNAETNPALLRALLKDICRRLYHAQHMRSLSVEDVAGRVACALVYLQDKFGDTIPHSRATLAELSGTTVESAIRATRLLHQRGILETQRNRIEITSLQALKDFAHKPAGRRKIAR
ncbi:MAG: Crp/Fnr family transcriptional regulator [Chthoniobacterales bacterium]